MFYKESIRSIGYKSNMLTTHISTDQNDHSYYNMISKGFVYILIILVDLWVSSVSIEIMK